MKKTRQPAYTTGKTFRWTYPSAERKTIAHKERKCEVVVRGANGKIVRDDKGKALRNTVRVPAYTQVIG